MNNKSWKFKVGLVFVIVSIVIFGLLFFMPFINTTDKIMITTAAIIVTEVLFWVGGGLLGPQLFNKYKAYLDPRNWFKKKKRD